MTLRVSTPVLLGAILLAVGVLVALGVWQLKRNAWKHNLVEERNARIELPPLTAAQVQEIDPNDLDYRRISAEGKWDPQRSFTLGNRARFQTRGEERVTPFLLSPEGPAILVNRGWYPLSERDAVLTDLAAAPDMALAGLIRTGAGGGHETDAGTWTGIDPVKMGATLPYPVLDWTVIEGTEQAPNASAGTSLPVQGYQPFINTTPHLQYALTWFALAIALVVAAIARFVIVPRRAERMADETPPTSR